MRTLLFSLFAASFSPAALAFDVQACVLKLYTDTSLTTDRALELCKLPQANDDFVDSVLEISANTMFDGSAAADYVLKTGNSAPLKGCLLDLNKQTRLTIGDTAKVCIEMNAEPKWLECTLKYTAQTMMTAEKAVNECAGKTLLPERPAQKSGGQPPVEMPSERITIKEGVKTISRTCPFDLETGKFIEVTDYAAYVEYVKKAVTGKAEVRPCP